MGRRPAPREYVPSRGDVVTPCDHHNVGAAWLVTGYTAPMVSFHWMDTKDVDDRVPSEPRNDSYNQPVRFIRRATAAELLRAKMRDVLPTPVLRFGPGTDGNSCALILSTLVGCMVTVTDHDGDAFGPGVVEKVDDDGLTFRASRVHHFIAWDCLAFVEYH